MAPATHPHRDEEATMLKEFREFAVKGNMVDMAVGLIIGAAFGAVVQSLVDNIFMPIIAGIFGTPDFGSLFMVLRNPKGDVYPTVKAARDAGAVVLAYGLFINTIVTFLGVAIATFFLVKSINRLRRAAPAAPAAPPAPSGEEKLLAEIRDILKRQPVR
jgi:large conductance mechanosensitive channel